MGKAGAPDVRVRLSAEGEQQVVNAFKRIQAEAQKTDAAARKTGQGASFLRGQFESLKGMLPALSVGFAAIKFVQLAKDAFKYAAGLAEIENKTGITARTLSVLGIAAGRAGLEQEALSKGLVRFTKFSNEYDSGNKKATASIRQLFGTTKALNGLNQDQRLMKIVDALGQLAPGAKRTGLAIAFFGKSGAELLPMLDEMGGNFAELEAKAQRFGLAITSDMAEKAHEAEHKLNDLKLAVKGVATQFMLGLVPAAGSAAEGLAEATTGPGGASGWQMLGKIAGGAIAAITGGLIVMGKTLGFVLSESTLLITNWGEHWKDTASGIVTAIKMVIGEQLLHQSLALLSKEEIAQLTGVKQLKSGTVLNKAQIKDFYNKSSEALAAMGDGVENTFLQRFKAMLDDTSKALDLLVPKDEKKKKKKDTSTSEDLDAQDQAGKAALALATAEADAQAKMEAANARLMEAAEKERYEKGLISLREYFANRIAIAEKQGKLEADALLAKAEAIHNAPMQEGELPAEREARVTAALADYAVKVTENQAQLNSLRADEASQAEALQQKWLDFQKKVQQAGGDRFLMARAELEAEAQKLDVLLRQKGVIDDIERARQVQQFKDAGTQQIDFEQQTFQAHAALTALDRERQQIQDRVATGKIFEFQGERQIVALERSRLPLLQQIAEAMAQAAVTPEQKEQAAEFAEQVRGIAVSSDLAGRRMADFRNNVQQALTQDIGSWLGSLGHQAENVGEAFLRLAESVVSSIQQIIAAKMATALMEKAMDWLWPDKKKKDSTAGGIAAGAAQVAAGAAAGIAQAAPITAASVALTAAGGTVMAGGALLTAGSTGLTAAGGTIMAGASMTMAAAAALQAAATTLMVANSMGGVTAGAASGGLIRGPGSGTSDSIPARLSDFEFVVRSAVVRRPGVLDFLRRLNGGGTPTKRGVRHFADGGLVDLATGAGTSGSNSTTKMELGLDDGLLLKRIEANPHFDRMIIRVLEKRPKSVRAAIGR